MRIDIHAMSFELTPAIEEHARERVVQSLGSSAQRIDNALVRLSDINGTHGGADKRCRIVLSVPQSPDIVAEAVRSDLYAAIDQASDKIKETVRRRIQRRRTLRREYAFRDLRRSRT